jgi:hypothetical protein
MSQTDVLIVGAGPTGLEGVFDAVERAAHRIKPDRAAGFFGEDKTLIFFGGEELIVAGQSIGKAVAFEAAFGLVEIDRA